MKAQTNTAKSYVVKTAMGRDIAVKYVPKPVARPFRFWAIVYPLVWLSMWLFVIFTPAADKNFFTITPITALFWGLAYWSYSANARPAYNTECEYFATVTVYNFGIRGAEAKSEIVHLLGFGRIEGPEADHLVELFGNGPIGFAVSAKNEADLLAEIGDIEAQLVELEVEFDFVGHLTLEFEEYLVFQD